MFKISLDVELQYKVIHEKNLKLKELTKEMFAFNYMRVIVKRY